MTSPLKLPTDRADLATLNQRLETLALNEFLTWSLDTFGERVALVSSMGPTTLVILDALLRLNRGVRIVTLDTGFLYDETHAQRAEVERRYAIRLEVVGPALTPDQQAATYGPRLWESDPDACCDLRKVQPLARALAGSDAWFTGLRRDQGPTRAGTARVSWDERNGLFKLCPLAAWTRPQVWQYIRDNDLPYNSLHDQGYSTIGCTHCTRPASDPSDERSGRWAGSEKTECGLHWNGRNVVPGMEAA
jgi:phosphoadenosine phosphosulfate reductase